MVRGRRSNSQRGQHVGGGVGAERSGGDLKEGEVKIAENLDSVICKKGPGTGGQDQRGGTEIGGRQRGLESRGNLNEGDRPNFQENLPTVLISKRGGGSQREGEAKRNEDRVAHSLAVTPSE